MKPAARSEDPEGAVSWRQQSVAGVPLRRFVGMVGEIVIGTVEFDGSNRLWVWSSPLSDEAWGYGPSENAAKQALEVWVWDWIDNFRAFFDRRPPGAWPT